jgi:hypothetical protein
MIRRGMRLFILISMVSSTIAIDGAVFRHSADAASHSPLEQILDAVTSLQGSVSALQTGAISDLQTQITALQSAVSSLQTSVNALQSQLVGSGRSNVRVTPEIDVRSDENAGCTVINVSLVALEIRTEMLSFDGTAIDEDGVFPRPAVSTDIIPAGHVRTPIGLNQPATRSRIHCKFSVLSQGRSRSDIRGQAEHVQANLVVPAE